MTKDTRRNRVRSLTPAQRENQQRKADAALTALCKVPALAGSITHCAGTARGRYQGHELTTPSTRPGADNHMALPSRMGERRVYRAGAA